MEAVSFFLTSDQPYGDFSVDSSWVYAPGGSSKPNRDVLYTPIDGSSTFSVTVYAHFGGSPKLDRYTRW